MKIDKQITTVVDVTYICNATCKYCRWGNRFSARQVHLPFEETLLPKETLESIGTERVVLSGGEPRLHPHIRQILRYYRDLVDDVILITNGYGLEKEELYALLNSGATGITVSLDSVYPESVALTRSTPSVLLKHILRDLEEIAKMDRSFELGINSVVSHITANWHSAKGLLEFAERIRTNFVKFQPVFDDGYLSQNAPELRLTQADIPGLLEIAKGLETISHPPTNPQEFWNNVAALMAGENLDPTACGLGPRQSVSIGGRHSICYWLDSSMLGLSSDVISRRDIERARGKFESYKLKCKVGVQCFCTQNIMHQWRATGIERHSP